LLFLPNIVLFAQRVVPGILSAAAEHNGHAANAPLGKDMLLVVDKNVDFLCPFGVRHIVGGVENTESQIQDVWRLAVGTIPLVVLGFVKKWESCGDLVEAKGERIQVSKRRNGTSSDGLGLVSVD